ncbi:hypothetical protein HANVADRAFT_98651 [Hanseniaspora valbyensis NRRL Y-1626]|uniref:Uncharacterized protein n=1 Tax=Hanseniaspora valbyensis NRRL Y-1626 TaxID=766949 RepID=A0A1B7THP6_9ASCO|nr:hypothetical protein HANVADRAFT_98651 [Hanseniaspora valbyensis NRRL Y-1626]
MSTVFHPYIIMIILSLCLFTSQVYCQESLVSTGNIYDGTLTSNGYHYFITENNSTHKGVKKSTGMTEPVYSLTGSNIVT